MEIIKAARTGSGGIAVAPVYCHPHVRLQAKTESLKEHDIETETAEFIEAQKAVKKELDILAQKNKIFAGHREIAGDILLRERVLNKIKSEGKNALQALPMYIDGVGLFRSEFLYMEKDHFPTEEEQFTVYSEAAELTPGELTIRTLDIGGDKSLPYFTCDREENPFPGWRGIRISLDLEEMSKEQVRAILRAGAFGKVRILLPMIISVTELFRAKKLIEACKEELGKRGGFFQYWNQ